MLKRILPSIFICLVWSARLSAAYEFFTTDSLIEDATKLRPEVAAFLSPVGPLSKNIGVSGSFGPLGSLGPLGARPFNVTPWMRAVGNWEGFREGFNNLQDPLGSRGPLLLMSESFQDSFGEWLSAFDNHPGSSLLTSLMPGSPLHILGNAGPLGPMGVLGPTGPHGATGFGQTKAGEFVDDEGKIIQEIDVEMDGEKWKVPLYELYNVDIDETVESPDSFFGVKSHLNRQNTTKTISFKNQRTQWVSMLLVGDYTLDDYEIVLRPKGSSEVLAKSSNTVLSNFIAFQAPKDAEFEVDIKLKSSTHLLPNKKFRLFVSGSSENAQTIKGPHQRKYNHKLLKFASVAKKADCATLFNSVLGAL